MPFSRQHNRAEKMSRKSLSYGCCDVCDLKILLTIDHWSLDICFEEKFIGVVISIAVRSQSTVKYEYVC